LEILQTHLLFLQQCEASPLATIIGATTTNLNLEMMFGLPITCCVAPKSKPKDCLSFSCLMN
jgi:hypothetical protein